MANFPINLDLQFLGESKLNRAITSVKQLEQRLSKIKAMDLTKAMGGPTGDKIATLVTKFKGYANKLEDTNKKQITTIAQAEALQATFTELAANVRVGSSSFMLFNKAAKEQELVVKKLRNEYENLIRADKGMQSVEQREAQLARRQKLIKKLKEERRERDKLDRKRKRDINTIDKENKKLDRQNKLAEKEKTRNRNRKLNNIGAAAGFPLLFGGGLGSIAGGVTGAVIGGFGGSIVGAALGQQLDKLGAAALNTAKAFDNVASNLDVILKKLGETNTTIGGRATFLAGEGFTNQAAAAVQLRAQETLGNKRVQEFKELAKSAREFDNALERLGIGLQSFITPLVKGLADAVTGTQPKAAPTGEQKALGKIFITKSDIKMLETVEKLAIERGATLSKQDKERLEALRAQLLVQQEQLKNVEGSTEAERILLDLTRDRLKTLKDIGEKEVSLAQRQLTERRDVLAADQGALAVQKAQDELSRIRGEMAANLATGGVGVVGRAIKLEKEEAKALAKLGVARANAANSVLTAERQITRETEAQEIQAATAFSQRLNVMTQIDILNRGTTHTFDAQFDALVDIQKIETNVLKLKQKQERVGVREGEVKEAMLIKQKEERDLLVDKQGLQRAQAKAAHAERLDREQAIKDTRAIRTLEAEINAERQKRATDPEYMMSFAAAGLGFFPGSAQLEANQAATRQEQLSLFNKRADFLQNRINNAEFTGVSADYLQRLKDEVEDINLAADAYERLQPGIDRAALAQARYNEALAITNPLTDSLFDNLTAVVEGTKTAEQAFADFLRSIADMLMETAKQLIAQYIAIGIARMFAIPGSYKMSGGGFAFGGSGAAPAGLNTSFIGSSLFGQRAIGGPVSGNRPYLVGERGPELFVPGAQGNIVPNSAMGSANVTVNVDASGSSVEGDSAQASQLGKMLGAAVQAELIKQKRPGGLLAS